MLYLQTARFERVSLENKSYKLSMLEIAPNDSLFVPLNELDVRIVYIFLFLNHAKNVGKDLPLSSVLF